MGSRKVEEVNENKKPDAVSTPEDGALRIDSEIVQKNHSI